MTGTSSSAFAAGEGVRLGAINGNVFQDDAYRLGSFCSPEPASAPDGDRPLPRMHRDRQAGELRCLHGLARRRNELSRPGRHARAVPASHRRLRRALCRPANGDEISRRVQVLRAGLLQHRPSRTGGLRRWSAASLARRHKFWSIRGTTRRARTSSRSSRSFSRKGCSAASTSTTASTPTTTSSLARSIPSSCFGS